MSTGQPDPNTTCEEVLDLLHLLVTNEIEDDDASMVLTHLAQCKPCREALSQHIKLSGLLSSQMPWLGKIYFSPKRQSMH